MIVYDGRKRVGFDVLLHIAGSALYSPRVLPMAFISGIISVVLSNLDIAVEFFEGVIDQPNAYFGGISFIVGFVVVYRAQLAIQRYEAAQTAYFAMESKLLDYGSMVNAFVCKDKEKSQKVVRTLMRWLTLFHELASEEIQGFEFSLRVPRTHLTTDEAVLLEREKTNKTVIVMAWILDYTVRLHEIDCYKVASPIQSRLYQIISDAHLAFNEARRVAETPFPFPFAQITVAMISFWSVLTPIIVSQFFTGSYVISFATSFISTWMLFAVNEAASQLESPFDDADNDLPILYYSVAFQSSINSLKYAQAPTPSAKAKAPRVVTFADSHETITPSASEDETISSESIANDSFRDTSANSTSSAKGNIFELFNIENAAEKSNGATKRLKRFKSAGTRLETVSERLRQRSKSEAAKPDVEERDARESLLETMDYTAKSEDVEPVRPIELGKAADDSALHRYRSGSVRQGDRLHSPKGQTETSEIPTTVHEAVRRNVAFNANTVSGSDGKHMAAQLRHERDKFQRQLAIQAHKTYQERRSYRKMRRKDIRREKKSQRYDFLRRLRPFFKTKTQADKVRQGTVPEGINKANLSNLRNKGIFRRFR